MIFAAALTLDPSAKAQTPLHSIPAPGLQTGALLGSSVASDGDYTAVGAPYDDLGAIDSGVVKVFNTQTGALLHVIPNPSPAENDWFGSSVSLSGTMLLVGAPQDDSVNGTDEGRAYLYDLAGATPTIPVFTIQNPDPAPANDQFGISVAISGTRIVVGSYLNDIGSFDSAGSAYVYDLTGVTPTLVATLSSPNPANFGWFGLSVYTSGTLVVVGAYRENFGTFTRAGNAYVYDFTNGNSPVVTTLNNPDPAAFDQFGISVAVSGMRVAVGATGDDTNTTNAGSVYLYDLTNGSPSIVTTLNNPDPEANDSFGISIAISDSKMAVGAHQDDAGASNSGSAYVYDLGNLATPVKLENPSPADSDLFGRAVAVSDMRVAIGSPNDDTGATNSGSAYLYDFTSGETPVPTTLNAPGPIPENRFGSSVAVSGTYMVVGAPLENSANIANAGRAYVYDLAGATPTIPVLTIQNPNPEAYDQFGSSAAISGAKMVIGAPGNITNAGSAYVYDLAGATPTQPIATLVSPTPSMNDGFGWSVGISGMRVVIGAPLDDIGMFSDSGSAHVYDLTGGTPTLLATLNKPGSLVESDRFGSSVAVSGMRVAVGAPGDDTHATDAGSTYVYDFTNGNTPEITTLNNPAPDADDQFGISVAASESRIVVGAHQDDTGASNSGCAYVYDLANLASGSPTPPLITLENPSPSASDFFGMSVAISSSHALIGVPGQDNGSSNAGRAYMFNLNSQNPEVPVATFDNPNPAADDQFGSSVAITVKTCAIGMPYADSMVPDSGSAFVFGPAAQISVEQPSGTILPETDAAIDTGEVYVGNQSDNLIFTIRNNGTANLNGIAVNSGGANAGDFVLSTSATASTLSPGASTTFSVRFQPNAAGQRNASVFINSENGDVNPFAIALNGTGVLPVIALTVAPSILTEDGTTNVVYTFTRSGPIADPLTVAFDVSGTASFGDDYTPSGADTFSATSGTVTFAAGSSTATVTIDPTADTSLEADETVILTMASGSGYGIGTPGNATGTITNDDVADQFAVEQPEGDILTSGLSTVNHGSPLVGTPISRTFVIRNQGALPITGLAVSILGTNSADFIATNPSSSLAAGDTTSFTVTFTPSATGARSATLRITSTNIGDAPFEVALAGTGSTARDLFDNYVTLAGLTGPDAQPEATPYNDGVTNLLKYAFNLNAAGPDARTLVPGSGTVGLPVLVSISSPTPNVRYEFIRRKNSGLTYTPLQSPSLTDDSWLPMTGTTTISDIDANWERVVIEQAVTPVRLFFRIQVTME